MTASRRHSAEEGFTLLELLVAVTLLGLLMTALFGGLRLGARVWETSDTRIDTVARIQVVQDFLRHRVAEALPLDVALPQDGDRSREESLFRGGSDSLRFATFLPEHLGAGLYVVELRLQDTDRQVGDLVLRWQRLVPSSEIVKAEPEIYERVLLERVVVLDLNYFGPPSPEEPSVWLDEWRGRASLPRLIRIVVEFPAEDSRSWSELILRPMVDLAPANHS